MRGSRDDWKRWKRKSLPNAIYTTTSWCRRWRQPLTPEEMEMLRDSARDGVVNLTPEMQERVAKAVEAITIDLTG
jgi:hypothetical protein